MSDAWEWRVERERFPRRRRTNSREMPFKASKEAVSELSDMMRPMRNVFEDSFRVGSLVKDWSVNWSELRLKVAFIEVCSFGTPCRACRLADLGEVFCEDDNRIRGVEMRLHFSAYLANGLEYGKAPGWPDGPEGPEYVGDMDTDGIIHRIMCGGEPDDVPEIEALREVKLVLGRAKGIGSEWFLRPPAGDGYAAASLVEGIGEFGIEFEWLFESRVEMEVCMRGLPGIVWS